MTLTRISVPIFFLLRLGHVIRQPCLGGLCLVHESLSYGCIPADYKMREKEKNSDSKRVLVSVIPIRANRSSSKRFLDRSKIHPSTPGGFHSISRLSTCIQFTEHPVSRRTGRDFDKCAPRRVDTVTCRFKWMRRAFRLPTAGEPWNSTLVSNPEFKRHEFHGVSTVPPPRFAVGFLRDASIQRANCVIEHLPREDPRTWYRFELGLG